MAAVLIVAITELPAGGGGGKRGQAAGGSFIKVIADGQVFEYTLTANELSEDAIAALAAMVDASPNFSSAPISTTVSIPSIFGDPNTAALLEVLTQSSGEIGSLIFCESDANYTTAGVFFNGGIDWATINMPTDPNNIPSSGIYNLRIDMQNTTDVDANIPIPAGDPAGLISNITTTLEGLGFTVTVMGSDLVIRKPGDWIVAIRSEPLSGSSLKEQCIGMGSPAAIPTLSEYGVILLGIGLLTAMMLIRRRMTQASS